MFVCLLIFVVEVFKKFAQNTCQHCYTKFGKNPKSPYAYSGALKNMLILGQRSEILQSSFMLTKSIVNKLIVFVTNVSSFRSIGKWVFWNPCFIIVQGVNSIMPAVVLASTVIVVALFPKESARLQLIEANQLFEL